MTTTATSNQMSNQTSTNINGTGKSKAEMKPADAISKISKILDQLSSSDRKRVLAFFSATDE